jgi:hypothetical protein
LKPKPTIPPPLFGGSVFTFGTSIFSAPIVPFSSGFGVSYHIPAP